MNARPDHLWSIKLATDRTIGALRGALAGMLNTEDDFADNPEVRATLNRALNACTALSLFLEGRFDFANGCADLKEPTCRE